MSLEGNYLLHKKLASTQIKEFFGQSVGIMRRRTGELIYLVGGWGWDQPGQSGNGRLSVFKSDGTLLKTAVGANNERLGWEILVQPIDDSNTVDDAMISSVPFYVGTPIPGKLYLLTDSKLETILTEPGTTFDINRIFWNEWPTRTLRPMIELPAGHPDAQRSANRSTAACWGNLNGKQALVYGFYGFSSPGVASANGQVKVWYGARSPHECLARKADITIHGPRNATSSAYPFPGDCNFGSAVAIDPTGGLYVGARGFNASRDGGPWRSRTGGAFYFTAESLIAGSQTYCTEEINKVLQVEQNYSWAGGAIDSKDDYVAIGSVYEDNKVPDDHGAVYILKRK